MCMNPTPIPRTEYFLSLFRKRSCKPRNVRVHRLSRRWRRSKKMEMKNLKLYYENQRIIEENERLRRKALLLLQENQTLFAQIQRKQLCTGQTDW